MALLKKTSIYELLIRYDQGQVKGAHVRDLETIEEDGVVIVSRPMSARSIDPLEVGDYVNAQQAAVLADNQRLQAEVVTAQDDVQRITDDNENLKSRLQASDVEIAELKQRVAPVAEA